MLMSECISIRDWIENHDWHLVYHIARKIVFFLYAPIALDLGSLVTVGVEVVHLIIGLGHHSKNNALFLCFFH